MKQTLLIIALATAPSAQAYAEDEAGQSLMEKGAEMFLEGLRREMEPTIDDLRGMVDQFGPAMHSFFQQMGPALADLAGEIQDWSVYEAPELLPNGDIIIRKKPSEDRFDEPEQDEAAPPDGTDI
ncbi:MAG: hypothetical protein AAF496_11265 [Pseudomonadota bacterium]